MSNRDKIAGAVGIPRKVTVKGGRTLDSKLIARDFGLLFKEEIEERFIKNGLRKSVTRRRSNDENSGK